MRSTGNVYFDVQHKDPVSAMPRGDAVAVLPREFIQVDPTAVMQHVEEK